MDIDTKQKPWEQFERCEICRWARLVPEDCRERLSELLDERLKNKISEEHWDFELELRTKISGTIQYDCKRNKAFVLQGYCCKHFEKMQGSKDE